MAMLQIINNGASIKLTSSYAERLIQKNRISAITVVNAVVIRIDLNKPLQPVVIRHEEVSQPNTATTSTLALAINTMITDCVCSKVCNCDEEHEE